MVISQIRVKAIISRHLIKDVRFTKLIIGWYLCDMGQSVLIIITFGVRYRFVSAGGPFLFQKQLKFVHYINIFTTKMYKFKPV